MQKIINDTISQHVSLSQLGVMDNAPFHHYALILPDKKWREKDGMWR
jgi:hypothetical protein